MALSTAFCVLLPHLATAVPSVATTSCQLGGAPPWYHSARIVVKRFRCMSLPDSQGGLRKVSHCRPLLGKSSRRLSNITVAVERSSMNGSQESTRPTGTRWATQEGGGACCFVPDGGEYDR